MDLRDIRFADTGAAIIPSGQKWLPFRTPSGGFRVLLNRFAPREAGKLREGWMRLDRDGIRRVDEPLMVRKLAEEVVADIEGITDQGGKPVAVGLELKLMLLTELGKFLLFVLGTFEDDEAFRKNGVSEPASSTAGSLPNELLPPDSTAPSATTA